MLDKTKFAAAFAGDVKAERAAFLANAQVPWGVDALAGEVASAAWRTKPSWYLVTKDDKMIPPDAQRAMSKRAGATVVETPGSHAVVRVEACCCRGPHRAGRYFEKLGTAQSA
ncbi:alpha/beta hydrolase [Cupriavidus sp. D39]|nr:alpha/beta hydrolase [Cupriavidus sp. D39]